MKKALVIDDENRTRDLIAKMINSFGLNITAIPAGESVATGLKAIEEHNPDIVFLDIQMPDGTGFDLLRSIPHKSFDVIFITAHEEFAIKAIKFSALDYILKPVDADELKAAVHEMHMSSSEEEYEQLKKEFKDTFKRYKDLLAYMDA